MTLFYHGTTTDNAISIARDGAILSPWEQDLRYLKKLKEKVPANYQRIMNRYQADGITGEETVALELAKIGFAKHEVEDRVKCVSLTSDMSWLFSVPHYETILGIELEHPPQDCALLVPRKLPLDTLTEVHFRTREQELRQAFAKYKPAFKQF